MKFEYPIRFVGVISINIPINICTIRDCLKETTTSMDNLSSFSCICHPSLAKAACEPKVNAETIAPKVITFLIILHTIYFTLYYINGIYFLIIFNNTLYLKKSKDQRPPSRERVTRVLSRFSSFNSVVDPC
ncbi:hypothetical protein EMIT07CA2_10265 [Brevibacillus sp. IT-7CA2]